MTKMFDFDPSDYAEQFRTRGYVHIPQGLSEEFYTLLTRQVDEHLAASRLKEFAIGDKQQSLYQFPEGSDCHRQLIESVGGVCGLDPRQLVLSERHIKAYDPGANASPLAHKDRYASQVAVGFSVHVPPGSTLVFYPNDDVEVNPFNSSAELRASLTAERLPEATLAHVPRVEIHDRPRDVMMFRGNAIWHLRARPAGTTMLYLKLNAFHCDPLGEDPRSGEFRDETLARLAASDAELAPLVPRVGRRVDYVHTRYDRHWNETHGVVLWGERHVTIDADELAALRAMDGTRSVAQIVRLMGPNGAAKLRRLAARGLIDLCQPVPAAAACPGDSLVHWTSDALVPGPA